ncbi:hypothetical protein [Acidipila sp. EB88]|uniref:hypothetical protein n=1 Tax=Acidipila sp. EB88 TaxID=2305226 RepID=UPI000F5FA19C|nr:hypothetical protein [Acidipila sp. EB88]RRA47627.1 hypothetical protein D1Y84_04290 [Acidipila sp. EB88]
MRALLAVVAACLALLPAMGGAQDAPGRQRLILKDGSYQVVVRYEVKGDRVRFLSAERGEGWEELPQSLVDWDATARYNHEHAPQATPDPNSPAAQEAAELDRQAAAQRAEEAGRQPEVAPGLRLPDESGVWALDSYNNEPRLVRIRQSDGDLNLDMGHSVKGAAISQGGARDLIRLQGYKAVVSFHVARPVFFIAVDTRSQAPAREDAMVVDTHGASSEKTGKSDPQASPENSYALVRLRVGKNERAASALQLRGLGTGGEADGSAEIVATERRLLPGGHWMQVEPRSDLNLGQYSLIELLPGGGFNQDGWDFGVNPMAPDNKGGFSPVQKEEAP